MRRAFASCTLLTVPLVHSISCDYDNEKKHATFQVRSTYNKSGTLSSIEPRDLKVATIRSTTEGMYKKDWLSYLQPFVTHCDIKEIDQMEDMRGSITCNTLLIYDIDNTVFEPVGNYGSDQWFYYLSKVYQMDGFSREESEEKALELWNNTQKLINVKPVESIIPTLIMDQQLRGVKTIAMTARTPETADVTIKQLKSIDVSFKESSILKDGSVQIKKGTGDALLRSDVLFQDGVLFVGEKNSKGEVLMLLLDQLDYCPENVVFVDDRLRHLKAVEQQLLAKNIPYQGFRYGGADKKVRAFDAFTAEISDKKTAEIFFMGKLL